MTYAGKTFFSFLKALFFHASSFSGSLALDEIQLLTFICVGISCALCGTLLSLRRGAMLANALSHTTLLGLVVAFWIFGSSVVMDMRVLGLAALLTALLSVGLIRWLTDALRLQREAAIALVFTALFSLGVVATALLTKNLHIGIESVAGSGDLLSFDDLKASAALALSSALLCALCYKSLALSTFDQTLARSMGIRTKLIQITLMSLSSACIVAGFRSVGVVMVLAFFIAPALFARLFAKHLSGALWLAVAFVVFCCLIGCALARHLLTLYHLPVSTGALVATLLSVLSGVALISKKSAAFFRRT